MAQPPDAPAMPHPRRLLSGRLVTALAILVALIIGLATGEPGFAIVIAALAGAAAWDLAGRLDPAQPAGPQAPDGAQGTPAVERTQAVSAPLVAAVSALAAISAAVDLRGVPSHFIGLALAVVALGVWAVLRTGMPELSGALGRSVTIVFICGFGGAHAILLRRLPDGIKLAAFLVACVALYEAAAVIFEAATVQVRPGQNRQAPVAGAILCVMAGLVASQVANPPLAWDSGSLIGVSIALAAAAGRALPALFAAGGRETGMQTGAVAATLLVAAPVAYYVARVALV